MKQFTSQERAILAGLVIAAVVAAYYFSPNDFHKLTPPASVSGSNP